MDIEVKVKILANFDQNLSLPSYESLGAAGADIRAQGEIIIMPGERMLIPTGLSFEIPAGYELQVRPRSGLSLRTGLMVLNSPGTIDSDYRGELKIVMGNLGKNPEQIKHGDRIAQVVLAPVSRAVFKVVEELSGTERNHQGFGHTGI